MMLKWMLHTDVLGSEGGKASTAYEKSRRTGASKIMRAGRDQGDRWGLLAWRLGSLFPEAKKCENMIRTIGHWACCEEKVSTISTILMGATK
jgi:hypothetical protein